MGRASKDKRDIYYRKAKEEGYRARSAYKLLQIHEEFNILDPEEIRTGAVDLCAAPGSWSQVLAHRFKTLTPSTTAPAEKEDDPRTNDIGVATNAGLRNIGCTGGRRAEPRVVAVDLQEMAPIDGVDILQGDITSCVTANAIIQLLNRPDTKEEAETRNICAANEEADGHNTPIPSNGAAAAASASPRKADIVVCDGAPDVTGMHELDEYLQHHLLLAALHITTFVLRDGGCFVTKMFRGPNTAFLVAKSELFFDQVRVVKPKSSRNASMESFLLCQGFHMPTGYVPRFVDSEVTQRDLEEGAENHTTVTTAAGSTVHHDRPSSASANEEGADLRMSGFTPAAPRCDYAVRSGTVPQSASTSSNGQHHAVPVTVLAPFLSCGDLSGFDADMCYDRLVDAPVLQPVQPPLQAPYLHAQCPTQHPVCSGEGAGEEGSALAEARSKKAKTES